MLSGGDDDNVEYIIQQNILDVNRAWQDGLVPIETSEDGEEKGERKKKKTTKKQSKKVKSKHFKIEIQQLCINKTKYCA